MIKIHEKYERKPCRPEKILMFGEGNFLRAFVDYWFDVANEKAGWNGKCVLVQPIPQGLTDMINAQEGLYTLYLRGRENGEMVPDLRRKIYSGNKRMSGKNTGRANQITAGLLHPQEADRRLKPPLSDGQTHPETPSANPVRQTDGR